MTNNMHIKSEKYLRIHKIIQDDEEIPQAFTDGAKYSAKPKDLNLSTLFTILFVFLFNFSYGTLVILIIYGNSDNSIWTTGYTCILVLFFLILICVILCTLVYKRKRNKKDEIVEIPLQFLSRENLPENSGYLTTTIIYAFWAILLSLSLAGAFLIVNFDFPLIHLAYLLIICALISTIPLWKSYKKHLEFEDNIHHFITSKKVYFSKDITKNPYNSIGIDNLTKIECVIKIKGHGKYQTSSFHLRYVSKDNNIIFVEVSRKFWNQDNVRELFPHTEVIRGKENRHISLPNS